MRGREKRRGEIQWPIQNWVAVYPLFLLLLLLPVADRVQAAALPEDRTDGLFHYYNGGGVKVYGPALLVRKSAGDSVSVSGRYYMDTISSASPDVVSTASPYKDKREEFGASVDYLHHNSLMGIFVTSSKEKDYLADTFGLNVSHDLFDGLTTLNMGYSQGQDLVRRTNSTFEADINRYNYRLGVSQSLSRSLLLGIDYEDIAEEGYLQNPYRAARYLGGLVPEAYPGVRDSQAIAIRAIQGFSSRSRSAASSLRFDYRYFRDNWDIRSNTLSLAFQRYFGDRVLGEAHYRYYQQNAASFYSDNLLVLTTYRSRDKELSTFHSHSLGAKVTWYFVNQRFLFFDRMSLNFAHDYIYFNYDDYTNISTGAPYSFGANILQLFISAWY